MQHVRLGRSGLKISRLILGCMTYGDPSRGSHGWTLDEADSRPLLRQALDLGITTFDCANTYSDGTSEEIVGRALHDFVRREDVVIATKLYGPTRRTDANSRGLSRRAVMREIDASLARLGTDHIDLYQIHRWDDECPIEETMEALNDIVRAGKVRYLGASSMYAWQFAKAQAVAERHGWTRFIGMQTQLNLLYREEEREMLPLCRDQGVGVIPWSPLGRGRLARPWTATTARSQSDEPAQRMYAATEASDRAIIEAVETVSRKHGASMARIALAWVLARPGVSAPIIGASRPDHLTEACAALDIALDVEDMDALDAVYTPRNLMW